MTAQSESQRRTLAAYQAGAQRYLDGLRRSPEAEQQLDCFRRRLEPGAHVLELGSGPGRDADYLESAGLRVQRSDVTPAFVDRLRALGHSVRQLDLLTGELGGPWDGIWANAVLLHLSEQELYQACSRMFEATRPGAILGFTVKEGDGENFDNVRIGAPRFFHYWRAEPLRELVSRCGWSVLEVRARAGVEDWLLVLARRAECP